MALAHGWMAPPKSPRHVHSKPIPRLGGVAIFAAFVLSVAAAIAMLAIIGRPLAFHIKGLLWILGPSSIIFALGLWDDIRSVSPFVKFAVEAGAAVLLFVGGLRVVRIPTLFGMHELGWITGLLATVLWVVWITNAFNLIDGIDGLAAGSALFSTLVVLLNALIKPDFLTFFITAALAGCILGFLRYNFNPATIFLGDSGSLFIGFTLSAVALAETQQSPTLVAVAIPVVALGLPIVDTALAIARRFLSGKPLFAADREHIHHKLLDKGLSQKQVVLVLYAVSAIFGLFALFLRYPGGRVSGVVLIIIGISVIVGVQRLGYVEFFELRRVAQRTLEQREVIINNLLLRRGRQDLARCTNFEQICSALKRGFQNNDFQGFELTVPASEALIRAKIAPMSSTRDGLLYAWAKNDSDGSAGAQWRLSLELVTANRRPVGCLSVYRPYCDRPLMVDVNLLTAGFNVLLADAIERAIVNARLQRTRASSVAAMSPSEVSSRG